MATNDNDVLKQFKGFQSRTLDTCAVLIVRAQEIAREARKILRRMEKLNAIAEWSDKQEMEWRDLEKALDDLTTRCPGRAAGQTVSSKIDTTNITVQKAHRVDNEWCVVVRRAGKRVEAECYYTNDKEDAELTASAMRRRLGVK